MASKNQQIATRIMDIIDNLDLPSNYGYNVLYLGGVYPDIPKNKDLVVEIIIVHRYPVESSTGFYNRIHEGYLRVNLMGIDTISSVAGVLAGTSRAFPQASEDLLNIFDDIVEELQKQSNDNLNNLIFSDGTTRVVNFEVGDNAEFTLANRDNNYMNRIVVPIQIELRETRDFS